MYCIRHWDKLGKRWMYIRTIKRNGCLVLIRDEDIASSKYTPRLFKSLDKTRAIAAKYYNCEAATWDAEARKVEPIS